MIRIVTDSSSDLDADLVARHDISVVPLTIRFGSEEFVDREELSTEDFWERLVRGEGLPETAAPSAGAFLDTYGRLTTEGADGILVLALSSELSATLQAAVIAGEKTETEVRVVDSRSVSMGLGLQVLAAAEDAAAGMGLQEAADRAVARTERITLFAALDTIEFLKRGGRIGGASALVAGLLDIKPIITLTDGVIDAAGRVRTRSKAVERIVSEAEALGPGGRLAVFGGRTPDLESLADRIATATGHDVITAELGAVVGTHSGPGVFGVAHLAD